jgi:hypothetical protein
MDANRITITWVRKPTRDGRLLVPGLHMHARCVIDNDEPRLPNDRPF